MNAPNGKIIGRRLREARRAARLTQDEVARRLPVRRQAVSAWERGVSLPKLAWLYELLLLYDVSADTILIGLKVEDVPAVLQEVLRRRQGRPGPTSELSARPPG
ncbi:helix-turn-helix domain-containing protein [Ramlibacter tataouinensis]|uniref:helix-turn-helix domain-containing protein n=1 Tax=Ramlibacter tataouinensis TaxID=94132 RepID=UPI0009DAE3B9|nr:helix-turn-helix domain-containing protein [Ramlibacter tataouinensis]